MASPNRSQPVWAAQLAGGQPAGLNRRDEDHSAFWCVAVRVAPSRNRTEGALVRRQDLARYAALGVAGSRAAMGAAMVAAPRPFALALAGRDGRRTGLQLLTRATGG